MSFNKLNTINTRLNETSDILKQNIDIAIQRGEKLEDLQDKSYQLENEAVRFKKSAKNLKCKFCKEHLKTIGVIAFIVILIILILTAIVCANGKC